MTPSESGSRADAIPEPSHACLYLGTHRPNWLGQVLVPLFVSRRRLKDRKSFPRAAAGWVLDSGGYTELHTHGAWSVTVDQYAAEVRRFEQQIGLLDWCAPMDWMCEPSVLMRTGLSVEEHQRRTVENFIRLRELVGGMVAPVVQGWTLNEYLACVEQYEARGVSLADERLVAVGSVCRRGADNEIVRILDRLAREQLRLHAFGVRSSALERAADCLVSADSMAWSYRARRSPPLPGHTHKSCANCQEYALRWYAEQQTRLDHLRIGVAA
jgi:hypothetical protein